MALISVEELSQRIGSDDLRIADVRWYLNRSGAGRGAYEVGHLPGGIFVDLDTDLSATEGPGRHPLPAPQAFARRMEELGIGNDHLVVAYDDTGGTTAARLWWMLDNLGHTRVAVLDGGITAWTDAGHRLTQHVPGYPPTRLSLADRWRGVIDRAELADRLGSVTLLDARAPERYRGEVEPIDPAAGHIPTAVNAPTGGNLGPDGRLLRPAALRQRFEKIRQAGGIDLSDHARWFDLMMAVRIVRLRELSR
jgi:thiosulfate/3-mercaptopyruvate sulfurtransferase